MNERRSVDWAAGEHGRRYGRSWAFAALAVWLAAGHASAEDPPSAEETAAARSIALEGIKLADAGRCDDAIEKLARAQKLYHSPVVLGRLGECQIARGMLVEGTENLRKVLREPLPANPPSVVLRARERAQSLLDRAKGRIGALNIVVKGPPEGVPVLVKVDGEAMNLALLGADRPTDPGEHVVEASAEGYSSASVRVALTAADRQTVIIELPRNEARALLGGGM